MRRAYLEEADQEQIASAVRDVLDDLGARVTEHTRSHTAFTDLEDAEAGWRKGGYVGTYRHVGEDEVELRYDVHARFPERAFWTTVAFELLVVVGLFLVRPAPAVWVGAALLLWGLLVGSFLLYLHTWRSASRLEDDLLDLTLDEIESRSLAQALTEEERTMQALEEEVEADVLAERLAERRPEGEDDGPSRLARFRDALAGFADRAGSSEEEDVEAKRERVRELRSRLEEERGPDDDRS
jgi:hypothetical protein